MSVKNDVGQSARFHRFVYSRHRQQRFGHGYINHKSACLVCAAYFCRTLASRHDLSVDYGCNLFIVRCVIDCRIVHRLSVFRNFYVRSNCSEIIVYRVSTKLDAVAAGCRCKVCNVKHNASIYYRHVYRRAQRHAGIFRVHNIPGSTVCLCRKQKSVGFVVDGNNAFCPAVGKSTTELRLGCTVASLVNEFSQQQIVVANGKSYLVRADGKYRRNVAVDNQHGAGCLAVCRSHFYFGGAFGNSRNHAVVVNRCNGCIVAVPFLITAAALSHCKRCSVIDVQRQHAVAKPYCRFFNGRLRRRVGRNVRIFFASDKRKRTYQTQNQRDKRKSA